MNRLLVCTALRIEARAVRSGGADAGTGAGISVLRVGMGTRRARTAAGRLPEHDMVVVAGFGAGAAAGLHPGDVVVASEVRYEPLVIPCPWSASLAEALGRRGLPVTVGPLATVNHIASRQDLARMAADGVTAVDMESFPLVEAADGKPFAVVRVVVDTADHPLLRPATVRSGIRARARLREVGRALGEWVSSAAVSA